MVYSHFGYRVLDVYVYIYIEREKEILPIGYCLKIIVPLGELTGVRLVAAEARAHRLRPRRGGAGWLSVTSAVASITLAGALITSSRWAISNRGYC